jgi:hypothetical protein
MAALIQLTYAEIRKGNPAAAAGFPNSGHSGYQPACRAFAVLAFN